jgi:hypothetical protein
VIRSIWAFETCAVRRTATVEIDRIGFLIRLS